MSVIVLMKADDADEAYILRDGLDNRVFESVEEADAWIEKNARVGWCTRILDLGD